MLNRNLLKKIIIISIFIFTLTVIYFLNNKGLKEISDSSANEIIQNIFHDEYIEKLQGQALVISKNKNYMVIVVKDQYLLLDLSKNPPKIHHFISNKPEIEVKVVKIEENKYLVEHDDHTHWIIGSLDKDVKVGDKIFIKDPHTYLQELEEKDNLHIH